MSKEGKVWTRESIERHAVRLEMDELSTEEEFNSVREVLAALDDYDCDAVMWTATGWQPHGRSS